MENYSKKWWNHKIIILLVSLNVRKSGFIIIDQLTKEKYTRGRKIFIKSISSSLVRSKSIKFYSFHAQLFKSPSFVALLGCSCFSFLLFLFKSSRSWSMLDVEHRFFSWFFSFIVLSYRFSNVFTIFPSMFHCTLYVSRLVGSSSLRYSGISTPNRLATRSSTAST